VWVETEFIVSDDREASLLRVFLIRDAFAFGTRVHDQRFLWYQVGRRLVWLLPI
jgi:hypothetical protein